MRTYLLLIGGLWLVLAVISGAEMLLSARHRQSSRRLGVRPWPTVAVMVIVGCGTVFAGMLSPPSLPLAVASLAPMLVLSVIQRRHIRGRDDLPPPLSRMLQVPVNPLMQLRHPIRTARAEWAAFGHPIRSRREYRSWQEQQPHD